MKWFRYVCICQCSLWFVPSNLTSCLSSLVLERCLFEWFYKMEHNIFLIWRCQVTVQFKHLFNISFELFQHKYFTIQYSDNYLTFAEYTQWFPNVLTSSFLYKNNVCSDGSLQLIFFWLYSNQVRHFIFSSGLAGVSSPCYIWHHWFILNFLLFTRIVVEETNMLVREHKQISHTYYRNYSIRAENPFSTAICFTYLWWFYQFFVKFVR